MSKQITPGVPKRHDTKREKRLKGSSTPVKIPVRLTTPKVKIPPKAAPAIAPIMRRRRKIAAIVIKPTVMRPAISGEKAIPFAHQSFLSLEYYWSGGKNFPVVQAPVDDCIVGLEL